MSRYFNDLLSSQDLTIAEIQGLQDLRTEIQAQLSVLSGNPRFYYAGSYSKGSMIRTRYDLDIVIYWPHTTISSLETIYSAVGNVLRRHWRSVNPKTVCWEIPFSNEFHIDVVPGRALDATFLNANLYRSDKKSSFKTSLKTHIDKVKKSGRLPVIRLMKLWRERRQVPFHKSFLLELMTIEGCAGKNFDDFPGQLMASFGYIRDNIENYSFKDPANSNNNLLEDLNHFERIKIKAAAENAIAAQSWNQLFV